MRCKELSIQEITETIVFLLKDSRKKPCGGIANLLYLHFFSDVYPKQGHCSLLCKGFTTVFVFFLTKAQSSG